MNETIVFDPPELAPDREPLGLDELGIRVDAEGADWGESKVAVQLARQQIGSTVTDRHLEPVDMSIPLQVLEEGPVSLAEAAHRLQSKVGIAQADEYDTTWIRRDFDDGFGAAGSIAYQVHTAALQGLQGWLMAHRRHAPDVKLAVLRGPIGIATEEVEGPVFKLAAGRALEWELPEVLGTAAGLLRVLVKNTGANAWRAVVLPLESRDHPQDGSKSTTAKLMYEAEALTPQSASVQERAGASGGKVVRASLTAGWLSILHSKVAGVGQMTHVGPRRLRVRAYDSGATAGGVELQAQYRPLGATTWSETKVIVATPLVGNFCLLDLGELKAERATLGVQQWEWRILARAPSGAGTIDLDLVFLEPVEQHAVVRAPDASSSADKTEKKSPNKAESIVSGAAAWTTPDNAKVSDNVRAITTVDNTKTSHYLRVSDFKFALPGEAVIVNVEPSIERHASVASRVKDIAVHVNANASNPMVGNRVSWSNPSFDPFWPTADERRFYDPAKGFKVGTFTVAEVNSAAFGVWIWVFNDFAACEARVDHIDVTVYYTLGDDNRVCFATRSIEFRSDGVFRQHPEADVWGELVNEGFHPQAPPSWLEGRAMRGLIVPSEGDLGVLADSGSHTLEVQPIYFPGYHFAREAAS